MLIETCRTRRKNPPIRSLKAFPHGRRSANDKAAVAEAYREFSPSTALYQEVDGTDFLTYKSPIDLVVARRYLVIPIGRNANPKPHWPLVRPAITLQPRHRR